MFLCIPLVFGCQTKIKPEEGAGVMVCPRCHNASMVAAKKTERFELCWIPLIPLGSKHIWICSICQYAEPKVNGQSEPGKP